ncbi:MAG: glycerophosphodiester phosphodiesterase [Hyphomicrobiaceae bacterium]|nr:glycerophosphodiester phosphodiesterase [Hyphomicrobiaceae bacterium]
MSDLDWLVQPIAHRGLHNVSEGIVENTPSAIQAAIDAGYAVEVDIQPAGDGKAVVFHDAALDRLTRDSGNVADKNTDDLKRIRFKDTNDRMQTLPELLEQVSDRVPLILEIKSNWGARGPFERTVARDLDRYQGNVAVMSFDPNVTAAFASAAPERPRGLIACAFRNPHYWGHIPPLRRFLMRHLLSGFIAKPHFIAYDIEALPALAPWVWRNVIRRPLLTWTVRDKAQRERAASHADAMIFEGFRP